MKAFLLNSILAIVVLNVAPGYDACGNKIKDFPPDQDTVAYDSTAVDTIYYATDSIAFE